MSASPPSRGHTDDDVISPFPSLVESRQRRQPPPPEPEDETQTEEKTSLLQRLGLRGKPTAVAAPPERPALPSAPQGADDIDATEPEAAVEAASETQDMAVHPVATHRPTDADEEPAAEEPDMADDAVSLSQDEGSPAAQPEPDVPAEESATESPEDIADRPLSEAAPYAPRVEEETVEVTIVPSTQAPTNATTPESPTVEAETVEVATVSTPQATPRPPAALPADTANRGQRAWRSRDHFVTAASQPAEAVRDESTDDTAEAAATPAAVPEPSPDTAAPAAEAEPSTAQAEPSAAEAEPSTATATPTRSQSGEAVRAVSASLTRTSRKIRAYVFRGPQTPKSQVQDTAVAESESPRRHRPGDWVPSTPARPLQPLPDESDEDDRVRVWPAVALFSGTAAVIVVVLLILLL